MNYFTTHTREAKQNPKPLGLNGGSFDLPTYLPTYMVLI
jgi:hypothetical protein